VTAVPVHARSSMFGPLRIRYDTRVLTPRPWTLMQSRWAAELAAQAADGPILELCSGAGQIGLTAALLTRRALVQVEADPVAADYARRNAADAGLAHRVEVRTGRFETALRAAEQFPIILADPPYLPSADVARWPEDPMSAIDGGPDGLDLVRLCLQLTLDHLTVGGALLLQVAGESQARAVTAWLATRAQPGLIHRETRTHDLDRAVMLITDNGAARDR
jgi:methylase of polypeptide subunit release factors